MLGIEILLFRNATARFKPWLPEHIAYNPLGSMTAGCSSLFLIIKCCRRGLSPPTVFSVSPLVFLGIR